MWIENELNESHMTWDRMKSEGYGYNQYFEIMGMNLRTEEKYKWYGMGEGKSNFCGFLLSYND